MNKPEASSSGSNAGVVILVAILVLGLPCLAGVVLLGAGLFYARTRVVAPAPPPTMLTPAPARAPVLAMPPVLEEPMLPAGETTPAETTPTP